MRTDDKFPSVPGRPFQFQPGRTQEKSFADPSYMDVQRRPFAVYRTASVEPVTNLFKRGLDTLDDVQNSAAYGKTVSSYLSSGKVQRLFRASVDEIPDNLFKRGVNSLDDVTDSSSYGRTVSSYLSSGKVQRLFRSSVDELPDNLFKRGVNNLDDVLESGTYGRVAIDYRNSSGFVTKIYGGGTGNPGDNVFIRGVHNMSDVAAGGTAGAFTLGGKMALNASGYFTAAPTFGYRFNNSNDSANLSILFDTGKWEHYGAFSTFKSTLLSLDGTETNWRWQHYLSGNDYLIYSRGLGPAVLTLNYSSGLVSTSNALYVGQNLSTGSAQPTFASGDALYGFGVGTNFKYNGTNPSYFFNNHEGFVFTTHDNYGGVRIYGNAYPAISNGSHVATFRAAAVEFTPVVTLYAPYMNLMSTNGWAMGEVAGVRRLRSNSATSFSFLTDGNAYADVHGGSWYAEGAWFRNTGSGTGIYNETNTNHIYSDSTEGWSMSSALTSGHFIMRDNSSSGQIIKGYLYFNPAGFGLLNNNGDWAVRCNHGSNYGGTFYGNWVLSMAHTSNAYGMLSSDKQMHIMENANWSVSAGFTTAIAGKSALFGTWVDGNLAFRVQGDTTSRSAGAGIPFPNLLTVDMSGNTTAADFILQ